MKTFFLATIAVLAFVAVNAKNYPYDWKVDRKQYTLTADEKSAGEIILKEHLEYTYAVENESLVMYWVYHKIVRVNNAEAIRRNNRISVGMSGTIDLIELKARTINANGKIIVFDKEDMKEIKDEESGKGSRIFAMEGVETGGEIEYLIIKQIKPNVYGRFYLQHDVPVKESSFILKSPKHLEFEFRTYHGLPAVQTKQENEENIYTLDMKNVQAIKDEGFSNADAWNQRVEYRLAYNKKRTFAKLYTWDYAGTEFYSRMFTSSKDDDKAISKFVQSLKDDPGRNLQARIRSIERQIKTSIHINKESNDESLDNIPSILKSKVASEHGITKLFIATFTALKIPVQLVVTCNRSYRMFDDTFDSWNFLDDYLIYIPGSNTFLSPYNFQLYSPLVDSEYTGHKGLFIEPVEVASVKSGLAYVNDIPASPWNYSLDRRLIKIKFNSTLDANEIYFKNDAIGHKASEIAPYYGLLSKEQQEKVMQEYTEEVVPGVTIDKWAAKTNFDGEVDEFTMEVNFATAHFLDHAGPRILLKIGLIIGPQTELYKDDARHLPVSNWSNRGYERTINLTIPEGYVIKNLNDLNFNVFSSGKPDAPFSFVSSYKLEGQTLVITVNEYYKELYAPLEAYEGFRKVVNAAADFNKVTLVLEKVKR
jgi:hypothetical protein